MQVKRQPNSPSSVKLNKATILKFICEMEERAIIFFMSLVFKAKIAEKMHPKEPKKIKIGEK